jgi:hypothetical protein
MQFKGFTFVRKWFVFVQLRDYMCLIARKPGRLPVNLTDFNSIHSSSRCQAVATCNPDGRARNKHCPALYLPS